jgi:AraC family transcriptional regulator of adaptative response / DNA-3-methyladenine glycosylase II
VHTDEDAAYRAVTARDPRLDGRVYLGVLSTGIYCRPSCPARTPRRENCRFYPTAAAAVAAGFRACKRCRPDALPGSRAWDHRGDLAARAVRLIRDGAVDESGVAGLADRLHVSVRHLNRVLVAEVGAGPLQLARTRRAQTARLLVEQTGLPLSEVAFAAGFASIRQFNDVMRAEFGQAPSTLRRPGRAAGDDRQPVAGGPALVLRLRYRVPLAVDALRHYLARHLVAGVERLAADGTVTRTVPGPHGPATVAVRLPAAGADGPYGAVDASLQLAELSDVAAVVRRVRRWLDLDADPGAVDAALQPDPLLGPLVARRPGLRVPGSVDGFELAVRAVLGQQVALRAATTFAARLAQRWGEPVGDLVAFPTAAALGEAGPDAAAELRQVGVTAARARTLAALAAAVASGDLVLEPGADRAAVRQRLLALPGVGPWTADYMAVRALADPDVFPSGDLVLRRALRCGAAAGAAAHARRWSPWRSYAAQHLWTDQARPVPTTTEEISA